MSLMKVVIEKLRCQRCGYERPYTRSMEHASCPACQDGNGRFWTTKPPAGKVVA